MYVVPSHKSMSEDDFLFLDFLEVLGSYILRNQEYKLETNLLRLVARAALKGRYNSSDSLSISDYDLLVQFLAKICRRQEDMLN